MYQGLTGSRVSREISKHTDSKPRDLSEQSRFETELHIEDAHTNIKISHLNYS